MIVISSRSWKNVQTHSHTHKKGGKRDSWNVELISLKNRAEKYHKKIPQKFLILIMYKRRSGKSDSERRLFTSPATIWVEKEQKQKQEKHFTTQRLTLKLKEESDGGVRKQKVVIKQFIMFALWLQTRKKSQLNSTLRA